MNKEAMQLTGFLAMMFFGSALDSTGWAMWAAVAGVLAGMAMAYLGREERNDQH
jgi:membrane associated rhomboid family serine protease